MKFLIKTTLAAILISGAGAEDADRHGAALNGIDEKQGFLHDVPGSVLFFVRAQDDGGEPKKEKIAEQGEKEGRVPDGATRRKARARTRKQLETVQQKIEGDHALWTRAGEEMKESRERIAELEASLARERLQFERLRQSIARIEREHNGDHDREEELAAELSRARQGPA